LVRDRQQLLELWSIDNDAYEDNTISFEAFLQWWENYHIGLKIILSDDKIVGASGLWALDQKIAEGFSSGQIKEMDLSPLTASVLEIEPSRFWYCSGIVTQQRKTLTSPLRLLLHHTLETWLATHHIAYPVSIYSLGYSDDGQAMLDKLGFRLLRAADDMPDRCPLYWRVVKDAEDARAMFFKKRP
jgi:hypothetical protein